MLIKTELDMIVLFLVAVCLSAGSALALGMTNFFTVAAVATLLAVLLVAGILAAQSRGGSADANFFHPPTMQPVIILVNPSKMNQTLSSLRAIGLTPMTVPAWGAA